MRWPDPGGHLRLRSDSLIKEMIDLEAGEVGGKPYLSLVLDQHTRFEGIQTRLEAFLDMMRRKHGLTGENYLRTFPGKPQSETEHDPDPRW